MLLEDAAATMKVLKTTLALNNAETCSLKEINGKNASLEVKVIKLENELVDLKEKYQVQVGLYQEMAQLTKKLEEVTKERDNLHEQVTKL